MLYKICYLVLLLIIYSVIGWICEMIYTSILDKKIVNRGFLIGPYCPIYGFGCLFIIILLKKFLNTPYALFIQAMVICMALEYLTSLFMEIIFKARWWDYSNRRFNINGRVCLETAIPFGIGGLIIMYVVHPFIVRVLDSIGSRYLIIIGIVLGLVFFIDFCFSSFIIYKFKNKSVSVIKDNTEEINKRVREYFIEHSIFTRRLVNAFPNVKLDICNLIDKKNK